MIRVRGHAFLFAPFGVHLDCGRGQVHFRQRKVTLGAALIERPENAGGMIGASRAVLLHGEPVPVLYVVWPLAQLVEREAGPTRQQDMLAKLGDVARPSAVTVPFAALEPLGMRRLAFQIFYVVAKRSLEFDAGPFAGRCGAFNDLAGVNAGFVARGGAVQVPRLTDDQGVRILVTGNDGAELAAIIEAERLARVQPPAVVFFLMIELPSVLVLA